VVSAPLNHLILIYAIAISASNHDRACNAIHHSPDTMLAWNRPPILVLLPFTIALSGILWQLVVIPQLDHQLLALALLLLGLDQARMAIVDLTHIHMLKPTVSDGEVPLLNRFETITWSTIGLELIGLLLSWQWLGCGSAVVLLSQLWFNLLAGVQLVPGAKPSIQTFGIKDRAIVLVADSLGLILSGLYGLTIQPIAMATALLSMVLLYGLIKYLPNGIKRFS
jgi:hypothetical protein